MTQFNFLLMLAVIILVLTSISYAKASNESSYKFGYNMAIDNLTNMVIAPPTWNVKPSNFFMNPDICSLDSEDNGCPSMGDVQNYCLTGQSDNPQVTNSTSCLDGYVDGWRYWCTEDGYKNAKYCTDFVFGGTTKSGSDFPGTFMNENKTLLTTIMPMRSMLVGSTWNFINESNGVHPTQSQGPKTTTTAIINQGVKNWQHMERMMGLNLTNSFVGPIDVLSNLLSFLYV